METELPPVRELAARLRRPTLIRATERLVYERFLPRVKAFLRSRLADENTIAEVANDVLLTSIEAIRKEKVREEGNLPGFVLGVARTLANNRVRRDSRRTVHEEPLLLDMDIAAPSNEADAKQLEEAVEAFNRLEEADRSILLLTVKDGLKPAEIGLRMGLSSEVVRARKSRAIKRLAAHVKSFAE